MGRILWKQKGETERRGVELVPVPTVDRRCGNAACGVWMRVEGSAPTHRPDARFCTDACRLKVWRAGRKAR